MDSNKLKHLKAIFLLPFNVILVIPSLIIFFTNHRPHPTQIFDIVVSIALLILGFGLLFRTIALFYFKGEGTLAPWDKTKKLVIAGPYKYMRNPMIVGVLCALLGIALWFQNIFILLEFFIFFGMNQMWFWFYEEPQLIKQFGEEYEDYKKQVPSWFPRLAAYKN